MTEDNNKANEDLSKNVYAKFIFVKEKHINKNHVSGNQKKR